MQRQSLGSSSSKLQGHGARKQEIVIADDEPPRPRDSFVIAALHVDYGDDGKTPKNHRLSTLHPPPKPENLIHIIPILTLFCFLILYLCSHSPSQADLAHFSGFKRLSSDIDSATELTHMENTMASNVGSVVTIRNLRSLQGTGGGNHAVKLKSQMNRKFANF